MSLNAFEPDLLQRVTNNAYNMADQQLPEPFRSLAGLAAGPVMLGAELGDKMLHRLDEIDRKSPLGKVLAHTLDAARNVINSVVATIEGGDAGMIDPDSDF